MSTFPQNPADPNGRWNSIPDFSPKEADLFKQAQEMDSLFKSPAFLRILAFMEEAEKAALKAIRLNHSQEAAWGLQTKYTAACQLREWILRYIDIVRETKRELLVNLLQESGIPNNAIEVVGALLDHNRVPIMSKPEAFR